MAVKGGFPRPSNGGKRKGAGRPFGSGRAIGSTTVVRSLREIVAEFVDKNMVGAQQLFGRVAESDPGRALQILMGFAEFTLPKLARMEHTGDGGGPIVHDNAERAARLASILARANASGDRLVLVPGSVDADGGTTDGSAGIAS